MTTIVAQRISQMLIKAGRTKADSVVLPDRIIGFAEWVDLELEPMRQALRASRIYVEVCADDTLPNLADDALKLIDQALAS